MSGFAVARLAAFGGLVLTLLFGGSAPASAQQGFLSAIFGRASTSTIGPRGFAPPLYQPEYPSFRVRSPGGGPRKPRLRLVRTGPQIYKTPIVLAGSLGAFLLDPTLRRGDVMVTTSGLMVYRGAGGGNHAHADFTPFSRVGALAPRARAALAALDKAIDRSASGAEPAPMLAQAREPVVAQDDGDEAGANGAP